MARYRRRHRPVYYVQEPTDFGSDPCGQREPTMETAVMAGKKGVKPVAATEVAPKAVRLDLDPDLHRELRIAAAKLGEPIAAVVRDLVVKFLAECKRKGGGK